MRLGDLDRGGSRQGLLRQCVHVLGRVLGCQRSKGHTAQAIRDARMDFTVLDGGRGVDGDVPLIDPADEEAGGGESADLGFKNDWLLGPCEDGLGTGNDEVQRRELGEVDGLIGGFRA